MNYHIKQYWEVEVKLLEREDDVDISFEFYISNKATFDEIKNCAKSLMKNLGFSNSYKVKAYDLKLLKDYH